MQVYNRGNNNGNGYPMVNGQGGLYAPNKTEGIYDYNMFPGHYNEINSGVGLLGE